MEDPLYLEVLVVHLFPLKDPTILSVLSITLKCFHPRSTWDTLLPMVGTFLVMASMTCYRLFNLRIRTKDFHLTCILGGILNQVLTPRRQCLPPDHDSLVLGLEEAR